MRAHPWFTGINWADVEAKRVRPLFKPHSPFVRRPPAVGDHVAMKYSLREKGGSSADTVVLRPEIIAKRLSTSAPQSGITTPTSKGSISPRSSLSQHSEVGRFLLSRSPRPGEAPFLPARILGFSFCNDESADASVTGELRGATPSQEPHALDEAKDKGKQLKQSSLSLSSDGGEDPPSAGGLRPFMRISQDFDSKAAGRSWLPRVDEDTDGADHQAPAAAAAAAPATAGKGQRHKKNSV
jgi:hypothetical protein